MTDQPAWPPKAISRLILRVRFCDTDLMGIVHHGSYLEYFEAARVEYMRRRGIDYLSWVDRGLHLPVVEAHVRYRKTLRFDERFVVEVGVASVSRVTVKFVYRLLRESPAEAVAAEGFTLLACVGNDHAPKRLPADVAAILTGPETMPRPADEV
jgi:acyl-CoA thioester hydrolase